MRLYYLDNLKIFLTVLVVLHHSFEPWATGKGAIPVHDFSLPLAIIMGVNASFFMGLFFFISGYFTPQSIDKKGPARFCRERLLRLFLPAIIYGVMIQPVVRLLVKRNYLGQDVPPFFEFWSEYMLKSFSFGHLWFVMLLLYFSLAYALWIHLRGAAETASPGAGADAPTSRGTHVFLFSTAAVLTVLTFIVRIWFPQDMWIAAAGLIQIEPAHFPQYLTLFILGIISRRQNWLDGAPSSPALWWAVIGFLPTAALGAIFTKQAFLGAGFTGIGFLAALREALLCVGVCYGLIILFRNRFPSSSAFSRMLGANAYAVYVIHIPIVIFLQCHVAGMGLSPAMSAILTLLMALPLSWGLSSLVVRRLPGFKKVLG